MGHAEPGEGQLFSGMEAIRVTYDERLVVEQI